MILSPFLTMSESCTVVYGDDAQLLCRLSNVFLAQVHQVLVRVKAILLKVALFAGPALVAFKLSTK